MIAGKDLENRPRPDHVAAAEVRNAIVSGRWVDAGDLLVGDILLLKDGRRLPVQEIVLRQVARTIYNFQVHELHNYAVGNDCVLVHNNAKCSFDIDDFNFVDPGHRGSILINGKHIEMRESFNLTKMERSRPFNQALSDADAPIRAIVTRAGDVRIMQGNHRVWAAQADGLRHVEGLLYTTDEWLQLISQF